MKRKRQRGLRLNPAWCYLCGLPIPRDIVSPTHPLFGTVDHTIPRSRGGPDALYNRAPVHLLCNQAKGDRIIYDPERYAEELAKKVIPLLQSMRRNVSRGDRATAIRRVVEEWPSWALTFRQDKKFELQRWEDDGGSVI